MNFRQRIILDRLLAVPLSVACNTLVRIVGKIWPRNHSLEASTTREIVVCKLVGMGSLIQATPLIKALKQRFPAARLTLVTLKGNSDLAKRLEGIDDILCLDDSGLTTMLMTTIRATLQLISRRVDHYFDLEVYAGFTCLLSIFSMARNRLGFYRHSNRFKKGIYTHLVYFNTRMPVRRLYLQLGCVAGVPSDSSDHLGTIRIAPTEHETLAAKLDKIGLQAEDKYILVNPNASDLLLERRWPEEYVIDLLPKLIKQGYHVALTGSSNERAYVTEICRQLAEPDRNKVVNTAGILSLGEFLALLDGATTVITNDTGPMHMSIALGKPTVCLFGPGSPLHYGSLEANVITLYAPVPCSPCLYEIDLPPCNGNNVCMQRLSPDLVLKSVQELASQKELSSTSLFQMNQETSLPLVWEDSQHNPLGVIIRDSIPNHPKTSKNI